MRIVSIVLLTVSFPALVMGQSNSKPAPLPSRVAPAPIESRRDSHLRQAAHHLREAGFAEEADKFLELADRHVRLQAELQQKIATRDALNAEIDRLRQMMGQQEQIAVYVTLYELSLTKLRKAHFDLKGIDEDAFKADGFLGILSEGARDEQLTIDGQDPARFGVIGDTDCLAKVVAALKETGALKVLAEPTIVTAHGRAASFSSGGEIPILVPQSTGTVAIEWRRFGTQLDCTPFLLGNGRLRLDIRPSFTTIHTNQEVTLANFTVPAFRTRQLDTAIELNVGETAVFAGLRQEERVEDGGVEELEIVFTIRTEYPFIDPAAR